MTAQDTLSTPRTQALAAVLEKFPGEVAKIRHLFHHNPSFQSLCEDYRVALTAWQHWGQATSEEAPAVCQSYLEILGELEEEVRQYLETVQA